MNVPADLRYTKTHEWIRVDGKSITVGITDYAQEQLGDLTYVEPPTPKDNVEAEEEVAVVESVKAASDVYAPLTGTITEVNNELIEQPELINSDPYGKGWIFKMIPENMGDVKGLLSADEYEEMAPEEEEE